MGTQFKEAMLKAGAHKIKVRRAKRVVQRAPSQRSALVTRSAMYLKDTQPGPITRK